MPKPAATPDTSVGGEDQVANAVAVHIADLNGSAFRAGECYLRLKLVNSVGSKDFVIGRHLEESRMGSLPLSVVMGDRRLSSSAPLGRCGSTGPVHLHAIRYLAAPVSRWMAGGALLSTLGGASCGYVGGEGGTGVELCVRREGVEAPRMAAGARFLQGVFR